MSPTILIATSTWFNSTARLAMAFAQQGCEVAAICPKGHPLLHTHAIGQHFRYKAAGSLQSLLHAIETCRPDLIVPGDDRAVLHLHALHGLGGYVAGLVERSLGAAGWFTTLETRQAVLQQAAAEGIRVPPTMRLTTEADLDRWVEPFPWVIKSSRSWGGEGVRIVRSREEAAAAFQAMARPLPAAAAIKRLLVNHDGFWLEPAFSRIVPEIIVQGFVAGAPANTAMTCWQGDMLAALNVQALDTQGPTGAASIVRVIDNPAMTDAARRLTMAMGLSGFHGLDFMVDDQGVPWLIEVNPRATQLCHLALSGGQSLAAALCDKLFDRACPDRAQARPGITIALFPQAWRSDPLDQRLRSEVHDVPWEEPDLVKALMAPDWPNRSWLAQAWLRLFGQDGVRAAWHSAQQALVHTLTLGGAATPLASTGQGSKSDLAKS